MLSVGSGSLTQAQRVGEPAQRPQDTPVYGEPGGVPTIVRGSPTQAGEWQLHNRPAQGPDPNLANLLGSGETTFLIDFEPTNVFTLPAGVGSSASIKVTNNSEWPELLKRWSLHSSTHKQFVFRVRRGDGRLVIGDGWLHASAFTGTTVPLQLGPGIELERLADLTIEFVNLNAAATDIVIGFSALQIANPAQLPSGRTLREQVALLDQQAQKVYHWNGLNPQDRGLGAALIDFGRFYTFPLTQGVVRDNTDPRFQAIDLSINPVGAPNRGAFRNETGGVFVWQYITFFSIDGAVVQPFAFEINTGAKGWKLTEGFVDSRLLAPAGTNSIDQWTPAWLPRPWIIKDQTTVVVNLATAEGSVATPGVWFAAGGILIGGNVL